MNAISQPHRDANAHESYQQWTAIYDEFENPLGAMVSHVLRRPAFDITGARVLELGCGTGRNIDRLFEQRVASYTGVDESPAMLGIAEHRRRSGADIELLRRDLREPWWNDVGQFDVVLVSLVLERFEQAAPILRGAGNVVAPGGTLWLLELHPAFRAAEDGAQGSDDHDGPTRFAHSAHELRAALTSTGWEPVASTDWCPTTRQASDNRTLARHLAQPVLLEVRATRPDSC